MNPLAIAKTVTTVAVSMGVGGIVGNVIKTTLPANPKLYQKISYGFGGFVLSGYVADKVSQHYTEQIDTTVEQIKTLKTVIQAQKSI